MITIQSTIIHDIVYTCIARQEILTFYHIPYCRYVLDGWPQTKAHVDLLTKYRVIPVCLVELQVSDEEMMRRAESDREAPKKPYPLHDSPSIMLIRSGHYRKHVEAVRRWYEEQHDNWHVVDGERNKWYVWSKARTVALHTAQQIQQYLLRVTQGEFACKIDTLCGCLILCNINLCKLQHTIVESDHNYFC